MIYLLHITLCMRFCINGRIQNPVKLLKAVKGHAALFHDNLTQHLNLDTHHLRN